jgi:DNA-binding PadR family transcriptional regulator
MNPKNVFSAGQTQHLSKHCLYGLTNKHTQKHGYEIAKKLTQKHLKVT